MGKRRIRNLQHLEAGELLGFDPRPDRREEAAARYGVETCASFEDGMAWDPDAVVVSTPPDLHAHYASRAARAGKHFFTELNVVDDGLDELIRAVEGTSIVAAPSCTWRHHPSVKMLKQLVDDRAVGPILYFTFHSGEYLPDWHPYEDYRTFYAAQRHQGGGRDMMAFHLNWLTWIFGPVVEVSCLKGKVSRLETDIDDLYQCLMRFGSGVTGTVVVDVVARVPTRLTRCYSDDGVIVWDHDLRRVQVWSARDRAWKEYLEPELRTEPGYLFAEDPYTDEMRHFVNAVRGEGKYGYTLSEDREILRVVRAAELSADRSAGVRVPA